MCRTWTIPYEVAAHAALGVIATLMLAACASAPVVLPPSGIHPVRQPAEVKIYQSQPKKYELLGAVSVPITPEMKWDQRGNSNPAFEALLAQAVAKGANGLLLMAEEGTYDYRPGAGYKGTYFLVPLKWEPRTAMAQAIFVIEE